MKHSNTEHKPGDVVLKQHVSDFLNKINDRSILTTESIVADLKKLSSLQTKFIDIMKCIANVKKYAQCAKVNLDFLNLPEDVIGYDSVSHWFFLVGSAFEKGSMKYDPITNTIIFPGNRSITGTVIFDVERYAIEDIESIKKYVLSSDKVSSGPRQIYVFVMAAEKYINKVSESLNKINPHDLFDY